MLKSVAALRLNSARICKIELVCPSPRLSIELSVSANTDYSTQIYMHVNTGHHHLRVDSFSSCRERPNLAGAHKLRASAQTPRERPNSVGTPKLWALSATVTIQLWDTLTAKLCCLWWLAILVSKALVFLSRTGYVGWVWWFSIRDAL